jgi:hypothetical protein
MHDPEMRNPASCQGHGAISQANYNIDDNATDPQKIQACRIARIYAVTYTTAATIARLCYSVAP